jgi:hypothetical protein
VHDIEEAAMSAAETQMDLDRITHPLRLAQGSHQPGSGKGCAMNAISYINGDTAITDFPTCSARPLAILVQSCNDLLAGPGGYLSPENSVLALELAWQSVGTADVADTVVHAWLAELLANPIWGVVQYAKITAVKAILDIAELHRNAARGDMPSIAAWDAADCAARAAARAISPTSNAAGAFAIRAAYESTAVVNAQHYQATLDVVTAFAVRAHTRATTDTAASRAVELARHAIASWHHLAGLDNSANEATSVHNPGKVVSQAELVLTQ